jgi:hypothetical protein
VLRRYDLLSIGGLIRQDKSCFDLYRHAVGQYDSSRLLADYRWHRITSYFLVRRTLVTVLSSINLIFIFAKFKMAEISTRIKEPNVSKQCYSPFNANHSENSKKTPRPVLGWTIKVVHCVTKRQRICNIGKQLQIYPNVLELKQLSLQDRIINEKEDLKNCTKLGRSTLILPWTRLWGVVRRCYASQSISTNLHKSSYISFS